MIRVNSIILGRRKKQKEHDSYKLSHVACYSLVSVWKLDKKPYFQY